MKNQKIDFEKSTAKYNFRDEMYYYCSCKYLKEGM